MSLYSEFEDTYGILTCSKVSDVIFTDGLDKAKALKSYFKSVLSNEPDAPLLNKGIISSGILKDLIIYKASGSDCVSTRCLKLKMLLLPFSKLFLASHNVPYD